ncbi:hypothetical protein DFS34DRAFT_673420 [Phlyctochytrium arcticum]|nr:hypothetical protein DFS34DRAFT_673420 [Phlyctochytrium arcticum]
MPTKTILFSLPLAIMRAKDSDYWTMGMKRKSSTSEKGLQQVEFTLNPRASLFFSVVPHPVPASQGLAAAAEPQPGLNPLAQGWIPTAQTPVHSFFPDPPKPTVIWSNPISTPMSPTRCRPANHSPTSAVSSSSDPFSASKASSSSSISSRPLPHRWLPTPPKMAPALPFASAGSPSICLGPVSPRISTNFMLSILSQQYVGKQELVRFMHLHAYTTRKQETCSSHYISRSTGKVKDIDILNPAEVPPFGKQRNPPLCSPHPSEEHYSTFNKDSLLISSAVTAVRKLLPLIGNTNILEKKAHHTDTQTSLQQPKHPRPDPKTEFKNYRIVWNERAAPVRFRIHAIGENHCYSPVQNARNDNFHHPITYHAHHQQHLLEHGQASQAFTKTGQISFRWNVEFLPAAHRVAKEETAPAAEPPLNPLAKEFIPETPPIEIVEYGRLFPAAQFDLVAASAGRKCGSCGKRGPWYNAKTCLDKE